MGSGRKREVCLHNGMLSDGRQHMANGRARGVRRIPRVRGFGAWTNLWTTKTFRWRMRKAHHHAGEDNLTFPVVMRLGETPVLIPNTMVKT